MKANLEPSPPAPILDRLVLSVSRLSLMTTRRRSTQSEHISQAQQLEGHRRFG